MKRKTIASLLVFSLCFSMITGCSGSGSSEGGTEAASAAAEDTTEAESGSAEAADEEAIYGEVTAIGEDSITIRLTGDDSSDEEQVITLTDSTVYTKQAMGGGGAQPGGGDSGDGSEPPEMPEGESGDMAQPQTGDGEDMPERQTGDFDGEAPDGDGGDMPEPQTGDFDGEAPDGDGGNMPEPMTGDGGDMAQPQSGDFDGEAPDGDFGEAEAITLADISEGDTVSVTLDDDGNAATVTVMTMGGRQGGAGEGGGGGQSSGVDSYEAATEYTSDASSDGETFSSTGTDENAIHVYEGANVEISGATVTRNSDDSTGGDNSSFYGVGAAILTTDGTTIISDTTVNTDAAGGAGVFSYGDGVTCVSDTTITTQQDTSGGIHVAGGGTLYAWDLLVETSGESSAAIRSDRGSGTMVVDGGTYISNGTGSPAVYSTADITVNDATLTANGSEAICIEGLNTIRLFDCDLSGNMADSSQNDCTWNIILYQSMSGDSEEGNSTFEMSGGSITAQNGGMFYTTNTESTFVLEDVDITYDDDSEFFLQCTGNNNERGWGSSGSNGADCHFTAISQEMEGDVIWDTISDLDFYITEGSSLTGAVVNDETYAGNGGDGYCSLYIDEDSTWTVTGDSTLTNLYCEGTIQDSDGNSVTITGSDGTVYVEGTGEYTITVDTYEESADLSDASTMSDRSDYEAERP